MLMFLLAQPLTQNRALAQDHQSQQKGLDKQGHLQEKAQLLQCPP